jgi:AcrR family transcriptional regulator
MPSGAFRHAHAGIVERLRARRLEIDEAIFARISDQWFDQAGSEDPEYVAGLRAAGVAALDYALVGIERFGESLEAVPLAALEQARRAARTGMGLDTVLRRYLAGYAVLEGFVMQEAEHDETDWSLHAQARALRDLLGIISALVDRLITAVSSAYSKEVERASNDAVGVNGFSSRGGSDRLGSAVSHEPAVSSGRVLGGARARILQAMVDVAAEHGFAGSSVKLMTGRAGVSSRTFYEEFDGLQGCFVAVLDLAVERVGGLIVQAFVREKNWRDGVLGALASLLVFFDSEPALTRIWFVESMSAGSWALERREHIAGVLRSMIVEHWVARGDEPPDPVIAAGVMASVVGLIQMKLVTQRSEPLIELLGPLMGLVTALYLGTQDRAREVQRGAKLTRDIQAGEISWALPPTASTQSEPTRPATLTNPTTRRLRDCLLYLAEQRRREVHPSNREIGTAIGVSHKSQISTLLSQLQGEGLAVKHSVGPGSPNEWLLTPRGEEMARALAAEED